jgi:hypothetical protein
MFSLLGQGNFTGCPTKVMASSLLKESSKKIPAPVITITPKEIDFGYIGPSEGSKGAFIIKNGGDGKVGYSLNGLEGWTLMEPQKLTGILMDKPETLKIHISSFRDTVYEDKQKERNSYPVQLSVEMNNRIATYKKRLKPGAHREMMKIVSHAETKAIFIRFNLGDVVSEPVIAVKPERIDFGVARSGEQVAKILKVTNKGMNTLNWNVSVARETKTDGSVKPGRFISFQNDDIKGTGVYSPPPHLKDVMETSGRWTELSGYPSSHTDSHIIKYRFVGTGISVFYSVDPGVGNLTAYVDDETMRNQDCQFARKDLAECMVADGLAYGSHTLTLIATRGLVMIEGVRVYGDNIMKGHPGWVSIFPDSGTTNRETDFVNITINLQKLSPGYYGEYIVFDSNGGRQFVEVSLEVTEVDIHKLIDVYRYAMSADYLYTSYLQKDEKIIASKGYRNEGVAFRLFRTGTPGTTPYYRWYHPQKNIHFYSYDRHGEGKSLKGYIFEGSIGNIGTSRLTNTRELYRWFNPVTGRHFFTTDPYGEGHLKKGYRFNGICGYVR